MSNVVLKVSKKSQILKAHFKAKLAGVIGEICKVGVKGAFEIIIKGPFEIDFEKVNYLAGGTKKC
jgi:hypothetical protein